MSTKTKIGVISIKDALSDSEDYVKKIKDYLSDNSIKALVIKMNCPGGSAGTSQDIFGEIKKLKEKYSKYVITFVENLSASGGYYIASASDYIIATPGALVGSIGSYMAYPEFKNLMDQIKVKYKVVKSGDYKTAGNPFLESTEKQIKMLQEVSDDVYDQFIKDVSTQRVNLSKNIKDWADGKIFTGQQALKLGLIDQLGSRSDIEKILEEKAKLKGPFHFVKPKNKTNFLKTLLNSEGLMSNISNFFKKSSLEIKY